MTANIIEIASWATLGTRHATIGDLLAVDVVREALRAAGLETVLLTHPSAADAGSSMQRNSAAAPRVWVSGPVDLSYVKQRAILGERGSGWWISNATLIENFEMRTLEADVSTARDGPGLPTKGDFAILAPRTRPPRIAAVLLRGHQPEYRQSESVHQQVADAVGDALREAKCFPVRLDTMPPLGLSAAEAAAGLEALLAEADVVITSRLHGIIHSVRAGKVPIVIDEIAAGGKVSACGKEFGLDILRPGPQLAGQLIAALSNRTEESAAGADQIRRAIEQSAKNNLGSLVRSISAVEQ